MNPRSLLLGTERGTILAVVLALLASAVGWTLSLPVEPPFPSFSAGYWAVVLLYTLPAMLVGAYDGGLLGAWLAEGVPFAVLWWPLATVGAANGGPAIYRDVPGRLTEIVLIGLLTGVVLGIAGFALGRGLRWAWDRQAAPTLG